MRDDPKKEETELRADAWERFEHAVDIVAKSSPQPRSKTPADKGAKKPRKRKRSN